MGSEMCIRDRLAGDRRFTTAMRKILRALQEAYDYAVDIEFTVNVDTASGEETEPRFVINLLQCRPLQSFEGTGSVEVPTTSGPVLLRAAENTMGASMQTGVDFVCVVDAAGYRACPHGKRPGVARAVGEAARKVREAAGAAVPFDILPAVWVTSLCSVTVGLLTGKCLSRVWR